MSTSLLFLGVVFSSIGLGYFVYGKKQRSGVPLACGITLMVYPYFVSSAAWLAVIGVLLAALPWLLRSRH